MKKYKRLISTASTTSDSSDDIPIAVIRKHEHGLFKYEKKACEVCEKVFYNQYDIHVHYAEHIIIPLLNLNVYQCTVCLFHFTSIEELQFHSAVKHDISSSDLQKILDKNMKNEKVSKNVNGNGNITKDKVPDIITKIPIVACDNSINALLTKKNGRNIESLFNKQPIVCCENLTELFSNKGSIKKDNGLECLKNCAEVKKDKKKDDLVEKYKNKPIQDNVEAKTNNVKKIDNGPSSSSIKSKIVFEDDSDLEIYDDDVDIGEIPLMSNQNLIPSNGQKEIMSSKTFTPLSNKMPYMNNKTFTRVVKAIPLINNQTRTPIVREIPLLNPTFTQINNLIQIPLLNPTLATVNSIRQIPLTFTPINNHTFIPPINNLPDTTLRNNFSENTGLDVEIVDLCSDEAQDKKEDYILPDEGDMDMRLMVPEPNYILPDCGPLLPVPPIGSQSPPGYGKIMLGSKIPQTTNNYVPENFVPQNTFGNYMQNFDINPASTSTRTHYNHDMFLSNKVEDVHSTSQPLLMENTNTHKILLGTKPRQDIKYTPSVHYEDLISPGLYTCKRCKKKHPTRLQLISHESSHIQINTKIQPTSCKNCPTCDRYITGGFQGMKHHKHRNHKPYEINKHYNKFTCERCNMKYRKLANHDRNYHKIFVCQKCGHRFEKEDERELHMRRNCFEAYKNTIEEDIKVLKVCELCVLFLKDKNTVKYVVGGEFSESGKRQNCMRCNKEFFELKLVNRIQRRKRYEHSGKTVKKTSNNERLKNIQNRLKMFNKLSRR